MSQFGLIRALVSIAIYNPAVESFNSYSNRKWLKPKEYLIERRTHKDA
jgi:hypothetical protein